MSKTKTINPADRDKIVKLREKLEADKNFYKGGSKRRANRDIKFYKELESSLKKGDTYEVSEGDTYTVKNNTPTEQKGQRSSGLRLFNPLDPRHKFSRRIKGVSDQLSTDDSKKEEERSSSSTKSEVKNTDAPVSGASATDEELGPAKSEEVKLKEPEATKSKETKKSEQTEQTPASENSEKNLAVAAISEAKTKEESKPKEKADNGTKITTDPAEPIEPVTNDVKNDASALGQNTPLVQEEAVLPSSGSTSSEEEIKTVEIEKTDGEEKSEEAPIVKANTEDKPGETYATKSDKNSEENVISPAASLIEKADIKVASTNQEPKQNLKQEPTVETKIKLDDKSDDKSKSGDKPNSETSSNNLIVEPVKLPNVDNTSDNTKSGEKPVIEKEKAQQIKVKGNDVINATSPTVNSTTKEEQSPRTPRVVTPQSDEKLQEDSRLGEYYNVYPSEYTDGKNPKTYNDQTEQTPVSKNSGETPAAATASEVKPKEEAKPKTNITTPLAQPSEPATLDVKNDAPALGKNTPANTTASTPALASSAEVLPKADDTSKTNVSTNTGQPVVSTPVVQEEASIRPKRVVTPQLDEELQEDSKVDEYYNLYPSDYTDGKAPKTYNDKTAKIATAAWKTNTSKKYKVAPNKLNSVEFELDEDGLLVPTSSSLDEVLRIQKKQYPYSDDWIKQQQALRKDITSLLQHNNDLGDTDVYTRLGITPPNKQPVVTPSGDITMPLDEEQKVALQIIEDEDPTKIPPITYEDITQREDNIYDEYEKVFRNNPDNSPESSYGLSTYVDLAQIAGASDIKVTSDNIEEYTHRGKIIRKEFGKEIKAKTDIDLNYDQLLDLDILFKMEKSGGGKKRLKLINYTDPSKNSKLGFLGARLQANYKDRGVKENQNKATYDIDKEALIQSLPRDLKSRIDNAVNSGSTYTYKLDKNDPATIMLALINPLSFDKGPDYVVNDTKETLNTTLVANKGMFDAYDTDQDGVVTNGEIYKQLKNKLKSIKSEYSQTQEKPKAPSPTEVLQASRIAQATVQADQAKVSSLVEKAMTYIDNNSIESFVSSLNKKTSNFTPAKAKLLISEFMKKGISLKYDPKTKQFKYVSSTADTPKYQQGGRIMKFQNGADLTKTQAEVLSELIAYSTDDDTYIANSIAAFEKYKGGPSGNPLTLQEATQNTSLKDNKRRKLSPAKTVEDIKNTYLPALKRAIAEELEIHISDFEAFPVETKLKLLDYKFNSGRSTRDLLLFATDNINAEKLNGDYSKWGAENTKKYKTAKTAIIGALQNNDISNLGLALYTAYSKATDSDDKRTIEIPDKYSFKGKVRPLYRTYHDEGLLQTTEKSWVPRIEFNSASAAQYLATLAKSGTIAVTTSPNSTNADPTTSVSVAGSTVASPAPQTKSSPNTLDSTPSRSKAPNIIKNYNGMQGQKAYQRNASSSSVRSMSSGTGADKGLQIQSYPMLRELAVSAFTLLNKETVPLEADRKPDYYIDPVTGVPANTKAEYRRQLGRNYSNQVRSAETSDIRSRQAGLMMANTANIDGESKLAAQDAQTRLQDRARFAQEKQAYTSLNNQIDNKNIAQRNQAKTATAMDNVKRRAASVDFLNQGAIAREYDKKNFNNLLAGKIIEQREDNYTTDRFRKQNQYIGLTEDLADRYSKKLKTLYQNDPTKGNKTLEEWTSDKIKTNDPTVKPLKENYDKLNKNITETFMQDLQEYEAEYQNDQINFIKNAYRGRFNTKRNPNSSSSHYTTLKGQVNTF